MHPTIWKCKNLSYVHCVGLIYYHWTKLHLSLKTWTVTISYCLMLMFFVCLTMLHSTLRETWKKPKSQNCFKIWISVVECMPINEWNMILSFKKVKHWFLVVKGVNYSTKIDLIELSRSKWSHPIQIKALIIKVWKNIVKPNGTNRKDQKMASESPGLVKTVFKTNQRIFLKLMHNHMHVQPTFLNKKIKRLRDSKMVF